MRRHAPLTTALVSLFVLTSYVGAAFVDCERPAHEAVREAARLAVAAPPSAHGAHEAHGARGGHGMPPSPAHGVHAMSSHEGRPGSEAPPHDTAGAIPSSAARASMPSRHSEVVLVPTCLCGCSETRALVGGSLARLGATIPAVHVAALPAAVVIDGHPPIDLAESVPFVVDDPVPI